MSSIMRARSGLMGRGAVSEVIGGSSPELKVAGPSMLGIGCPDRHALPRITFVENAPTETRAPLPRERVRSSTLSGPSPHRSGQKARRCEKPYRNAPPTRRRCVSHRHTLRLTPVRRRKPRRGSGLSGCLILSYLFYYRERGRGGLPLGKSVSRYASRGRDCGNRHDPSTGQPQTVILLWERGRSSRSR